VDTAYLYSQVSPFPHYATQEVTAKGSQVYEIRILEGSRWTYKRQNSGVRKIVWEKVLQPHRIIFCPSCRVLRTQAVDGNNTENDKISGHHRGQNIHTRRVDAQTSSGRRRPTLLLNHPRPTPSPLGVSSVHRHEVSKGIDTGP
jgi:hypothetical protein